MRALLLDWLPQAQFDRLLWCADLNVVRGEDSLVRALWAGAPFIWQLYPQHDGAHRRKLQAFLERWQADGAVAPPAGVADGVRLVECERPLQPAHLPPWPPRSALARCRARLAATTRSAKTT